MPLVKRVQKVGNAAGVVLNSETMALLGLEPGTEVVLEVVGDTLLVRRLGAIPPTEWQVLAGLHAMSTALVPADGARLIERTQRTLLVLRAFGPMSAEDVSERMGYGLQYARKKLRRLVEDGYVVEAGGLFEVNSEAFR